jgi:ribosomal protein S18 acetylase RimI-like enzyme
MAAQPLPQENRTAVPTSHYTYKQLAEIYNQARVDYIVPMPMNARRMEEYVLHYDIDLDASVVALNAEQLEAGIGMLGLRGDRGWITRLGVLPHRRGRHLGQYLMERMIESAVEQGMKTVQLEVIVGNEPARRLFEKLGFEATRTLLVIRRPPVLPEPDPVLDAMAVTPIPDEAIAQTLSSREPGASWVEETRSLLNAGGLRGLYAEHPSGERGWVVFQRTPFQLTHFVLSPDVSTELGRALLYHVHKQYAMQDTKIENVPDDHYTWPIFQSQGYLEVFSRTEMWLAL